MNTLKNILLKKSEMVQLVKKISLESNFFTLGNEKNCLAEETNLQQGTGKKS